MLAITHTQLNVTHACQGISATPCTSYRTLGGTLTQIIDPSSLHGTLIHIVNCLMLCGC